METHFLSSNFRLARGLSGRKNSCKSLTSRASCLVLVMFAVGAILPASAHAQGLFDILFGSHKGQQKIVVAKQNPTKKLVLSGCGSQRLGGQGQNVGNFGSKRGSCASDLPDSRVSDIITAAGGFVSGSGAGLAGGGGGLPGGGGGLPGGGTVTKHHGTHIALSSTIGMNGAVTVPGGGSLTVDRTVSVSRSLDAPVSTAPMSSSGFGSGMAIGSASSLGAGSANSSSFGNGDSFAEIANSGVFAGSSGGSGSSLGAGLGIGGGFGMSGSLH